MSRVDIIVHPVSELSDILPITMEVYILSPVGGNILAPERTNYDTCALRLPYRSLPAPSSL